MPLRFVVPDTVTVDSADIELRVGVPPNADTVYLPYDLYYPSNSPATKGNNKYQTAGKGSGTTNELTTEYCIVDPFVYEGYDFAGGKVEQSEEIIENFTWGDEIF